METGFPPNRLRNLTLLESLRVPALGIHSFSLTIIKLLTSVDYSRVVVTGNELLTTEGAPFRCALGVRDSAKGVRGGRESRSRLSEAATNSVATRGAGNGRGPAAGHRKTP